MGTIYVAGPYRGNVEQNIERASRVGFDALVNGWAPIIPHKITLGWNGLPEEVYLEMGKALLKACDAVVVTTSDYVTSQGTLDELALARRLGKPIFYEAVPKK